MYGDPLSGGTKGCVNGSEEAAAGWHSDACVSKFALESFEIFAGYFRFSAEGAELRLYALVFVGRQFYASLNAIKNPAE
jgi:hypothetical protein